MELKNDINLHKTEIKELLVNKELKNKFIISSFQDKIIEYCKNINFLQNEENYFNINLERQFYFNECIDNSTEEIKHDFLSVEKTYLKCRNECLKVNSNLEDNLLNYITASNNIFRPYLNPCLQECVNLFDTLLDSYSNYMIKSKIIFYI